MARSADSKADELSNRATIPSEITNAYSDGGYHGLVSRNKDNQCELILLVSGAHCALCIQKIEGALLQYDAVVSARLNFSSGKLIVIWDGDEDLADSLVKAVEGQGYGVDPYDLDREAHQHDTQWQKLLTCLGVAGFAMGNVMLISIALWITDEKTMGVFTRDLLHWISAIVAVPSILFAGQPFFSSAWGALKNHTTNMDVPIAIALVLATSMSVFEVIHHGEHAYFDSAIMLLFFLLIGRVLDFRARRHAQASASDLLQGLKSFATILSDDGTTERKLVRDLLPDMICLVAAGETIQADGVIVQGRSGVDTSLVTGETLPADVLVGDNVYAGTVNIDAPLHVKISKTGDDSVVAGIVRMMEDAQRSHAKYVRIADRAARLYTPVVHTLAIIAFVFWYWGMGMVWQDALMIAVTVLIITCPCALGLAVPVVQVLASGVLMSKKILLKSGQALERLVNVDNIVFDKTGTLTVGKPALDMSESYDVEHIRLAASIAVHSQHPLSIAMVEAYGGRDLMPIDDVDDFAGQGLKGFYQGQEVRLGSQTWCSAGQLDDHEGLEICLSVDGTLAARFKFHDPLRADAVSVVHGLQHDGYDITLLSGDRDVAVQAVAGQLGIEHYYAQQSPADKYDFVTKMQDSNHRVLMIGDGLNDAAVLSLSDVSAAPGNAIDMTQKSADVVFMGDDLSALDTLISVAKKSHLLVRQNLMIAVIYNMIAVPLAFAGYVTPMIAALAMSLSSVIVIANSFRLKWGS